MLTAANTTATTIKPQSSALLPRDNRSPNNFKWKAHGKIMHTVKHAVAPSKLMMVSNDGTNTANTTNPAMVPTRTSTLRTPRTEPDKPVRAELAARARGSRPRKSSRVLTMGRALRGTLVMGMMATQRTRKTRRP